MRNLAIMLGLCLTFQSHTQGNDEGFKMLKDNNCLACHAFDKTLVGPSYEDVAKRYQDDERSIRVPVLARKMREGGVGNWGQIPMPPMPLRHDQSEYIIKWILDREFAVDKQD
jgi:cytochrome c